MTCTVIEVESKTKGFQQEENKGKVEVNNASQDYKIKILRGCFILTCCTVCICLICLFTYLIDVPTFMIIFITTAFTQHVANVYYPSPEGSTYSWKLWIYAPIVRVRFETLLFKTIQNTNNQVLF